MSEYLASSFTWLPERALKSFRISKEFFEILAIGSELMILNASLFEVCIFRVFVAGIARQDSSFSFSCPIKAISAMSEVAYFAAQIKFKWASVEPLSMDL